METRDIKQSIEAALRRVVEDTNGRFDECLVDKLFESIRDHRKHNAESKWLPLDFEHYADLGCNINLARLLKYHSTVSSTGRLLDFAVIKAFVHCLPQIILRGKPSEITPALSHLLNLISNEVDSGNEYAFIQLIEETTYDAPFNIRNVIHLLKYLFETTKVYHIQDLAKRIFLKLVARFLIQADPQYDHPRIEGLIVEFTIELLCEKDLRLMHLALIDLFKHAMLKTKPGSPTSALIVSLHSIVKRRYQELQEEPSISTPNFDLLVKCVAYTERRPNIDIVEQLMVQKNLTAAIMYITRWEQFNSEDTRWYGVYILYPILARCQSSYAHVLAEKLMVSGREKAFIKENLNYKHVLLCLTYLHKTTTNDMTDVEWTMSYLRTVLEYLQCNINSSQNLKELSLCVQIIERAYLFDEKLELAWHREMTDVISKVLDQIEYNSFPNKPIFLRMLQLLAPYSLASTIAGKLDCVLPFPNNLIDLALKFTNLDVLNELTQILYKADTTGLSRCSLHLDRRKYRDLIWNHILPVARDTNSHDLIAYAASCLIIIDKKLGEDAMEIDVPKYIGDLLIENSHVYTITRTIIKCIFEIEYMNISTGSDRYDNTIKGICEALKSDCLTGDVEYYAYVLIDEATHRIAISADPHKLERLASIGALELLHRFQTCSVYERSGMRTNTKIRCHDLCQDLSLTRTELEDLLRPHTTKAERLAEFFSSGDFKEPFRHPTKLGTFKPSSRCDLNKLELMSHLDDILNDDRISHMAECY